MPSPADVHGVRQFLGMANFHKRYLPHYQHVVAPLAKLTGCKQWEWGEAEEQAVRMVKRLLADATALHLFRPDRQTALVTDGATSRGIGAALYQHVDEDDKPQGNADGELAKAAKARPSGLSEVRRGTWVPVAFFSKGLDIHEARYPAHEVELLAVYKAATKWRHWLCQ